MVVLRKSYVFLFDSGKILIDVIGKNGNGK